MALFVGQCAPSPLTGEGCFAALASCCFEVGLPLFVFRFTESEKNRFLMSAHGFSMCGKGVIFRAVGYFFACMSVYVGDFVYFCTLKTDLVL